LVLEVLDALELLLRRGFAYYFTIWMKMPHGIDTEGTALTVEMLVKYTDGRRFGLTTMFLKTSQATPTSSSGIWPKNDAYCLLEWQSDT
jgi:hypothetical protein